MKGEEGEKGRERKGGGKKKKKKKRETKGKKG